MTRRDIILAAACAVGLLALSIAVLAAEATDAAAPSPPDISAEVAQAPAVVLEHTETWTAEEFRSARRMKFRVRINTPAGEKYASQTIRYGGEKGSGFELILKGFQARTVAPVGVPPARLPQDEDGGVTTKLREFRARTIGPDGVVVEVPSNLQHDVVTFQQGKYRAREFGFSFPDVRPGAVLEWEYTLEREKHLPWPWWEIQEDIPVLETRFIARSKRVRFEGAEVRGYSRTPIAPYCAPLTLRQEGEFDVSEFVCRNVPAFRSEPIAPAENDVRLRMMFAWMSTDPVWGGNPWGTFRDETWSRMWNMITRRSRVRTLVKEKLGRGGTAAERAERVAQYLRRNVTVDESGLAGLDPGPGQAGSADEVLSRGRGLPAEVAMLAVAMGEEMGLKAYLVQAFDRSKNSFRADLPDYSAESAWMAQLADKTGVWTVDPSCRRCDLAVPEWRFTGGNFSGFMYIQPAKMREERINLPWTETAAEIPEIPADRNAETRNEKIVLDAAGAAAVSGKVVWDGQPEQELRDELAPLDEAGRQRKFREDEPGVLDDLRVTFSDPDALDTPLAADYVYKSAAPPRGEDGRLVVRPHDVVASRLNLPSEATRHLPLWWPRQFSVRAETTIVAPEGFAARTLPPDVDLKAAGLSFTAKWTRGAAPGEFKWSARAAVEKTKIPASDYPAVREFALGVARAVQQELVLEKTK